MIFCRVVTVYKSDHLKLRAYIVFSHPVINNSLRSWRNGIGDRYPRSNNQTITFYYILVVGFLFDYQLSFQYEQNKTTLSYYHLYVFFHQTLYADKCHHLDVDSLSVRTSKIETQHEVSYITFGSGRTILEACHKNLIQSFHQSCI